MKERASWPMKDWEVRAILSGKKTQTRRAVKLPHMNPLGQWEQVPWGGPAGGRTAGGNTVPAQTLIGHSRTGEILGCPHGEPGDQLWVREAFEIIHGQTRAWIDTDYRATYIHGDRLGDAFGVKKQWTSATHMTKEVSRITLELTGVRVERLQDISEADAIAEGMLSLRNQAWDRQHFPEWRYLFQEAVAKDERPPLGPSPKQCYEALWKSIHGPDAWDANPWVWVVEFKKI